MLAFHTFWFLLVICILKLGIATATETSGDQCIDIRNQNANIWKEENLGRDGFLSTNALATSILGYFGSPIDKAFGKCAGSWNISQGDLMTVYGNSRCFQVAKDIFPHIMSMYKSKNTSKPHQLQSLVNAFGFNILSEWNNQLYDMSNEQFQFICRTVKDKLNPCLKEIILSSFVHRITHGDVCCEDFRNIIKSRTNIEMDENIFDPFVLKIENALCSEAKSLDSDANESGEACIYRYAQSLLGSRYIENMVALIQIPRSQACKAFSGNEFLLNSGCSYQFEQSMGICAKPLDEFFTFLSRVIFTARNTTVRNGLSSLPCLDENSKKLIGNETLFCAYLPTQFSHKCTYNEELINEITSFYETSQSVSDNNRDVNSSSNYQEVSFFSFNYLFSVLMFTMLW